MSAYRRYEEQLELSRRMAVERDFALSRKIEHDRLERQAHYLRLKEAQKLRAQQEYDQFMIRRAEEQRIIDTEMYRQKMEREQKLRDYERTVEEERRARQIRDHELSVQQRLAEEQISKKVELHEREKKIQLERKERLRIERERENIAVLDQQRQQEQLEKEIADIEIALGTIYDARQQRKRIQLEELEKLDERSFKLKQGLRSSKVKQGALQESLAELSKLII